MKQSIDLGLAISSLHSHHGVPKTCDEIAAYCGCSWQRISQIEQKALRKLRLALLYRDKDLASELNLVIRK
jgi:DNA-directed RNA polymerase sigma subunit (sigma70/sigma32)